MYRSTIQRAGICLAAVAGAMLAAPVGFEVATIRPMTVADLTRQIQSGKMQAGFVSDAGRMQMGFVSIQDLIAAAYNVKPQQIQGPEWMAQEHFSITAKIPEGVSPDKVPEMIQTLLVDRFQLAVHHEQKEVAGYVLTVGKNGPKIKEAGAEPETPLPADGKDTVSSGTGQDRISVQRSAEGFTMQAAGKGTVRFTSGPEGMRLEITGVAMPAFAQMLSRLLDEPVADMTGLTGRYQITLDLAPEELARVAQKQSARDGIGLPAPPAQDADVATAPAGADIFEAVEKLGLKLEPRKDAVDMIVVDHVEKTPSEN